MTDIYHHLDTDSPHVDAEICEVIMDSGKKSNWLKITIGTLTLTVFAPSALTTHTIADKIAHELRVCYVPQHSLTKDPIEFTELSVEITSYNADPVQTDSTPTITASGQDVREGICALSRDIEKEFGLKFGDIIHIPEFGVFEFQDRMNKRIKRGVDIFKWDRQEALEIGRREGTIKIISRI